MANRILIVDESVLIFESANEVEFVVAGMEPQCYYTVRTILEKRGYWEEFKKQHPVIAEVLESAIKEPLSIQCLR